MKNITIAITTFKQRFELVKKLITNIRSSCDNDIILIVNADNECPFDESYRKDILSVCINTKNCFPIVCPEFKSLPKMWNTAVIFSRTEHVLLLNDDIEYTNNNAISAIETYINSYNKNVFRINYSYAHFVISKTILHQIGYFDERFCAFGEEDGDFVYRYEEMFKKNIDDVVINGIKNTAAYDLGAKNCEIHIDNKPKFNREFVKLKYTSDVNGINGMFSCPHKKIIEDYQQYPYEMFVINNKHNIKKYDNIDLNYDNRTCNSNI